VFNKHVRVEKYDIFLILYIFLKNYTIYIKNKQNSFNMI